MANTFTCEGTLKNIKNEVQAGKYVKFRITSVGTDTEDNVVYPKDTVSVITDANGAFSQVLWINGDSGRSAIYEIELPAQREKVNVVIPSSVEGTTVRLEDIIELYETTSSPQSTTTLATTTAYTDTFAADASANASFSKAAWLVDLGLTDLEGLTPTDGNIIVGDGTNWVAESGATARTSLGLGAANDVIFNSVGMGRAATASNFHFDLTGNLTGFRGIGADAEDFGYYRSSVLQWYATSSGMSISRPLTLSTDLAITEGGTGASTAAEARTNLGLVIGSDVQAQSAQLADIASLAVTDGNIIVGDGTNWIAESGATARTSLGLGTIATQAANSVAITGGTISGLTTLGASAAAITGGTITGITDITIADGGTGASTAADARTNLGLVIGTDVASAVTAQAQGRQTAKSVTFPSIAEYLSIADDATLDVGTGDFSIFFTTRIDSDSGTESIIYKYGGGIGYQVQFVSGALQLILNDGAEDVYGLATGLNDDVWHDYVITIDRSGNATAYVDSVAQTAVDVTSSNLTLDNTGAVVIGLNGGANPLDNGAISGYVGFTKDLITAAEILDVSYDKTRLKDLSNLSLCVDFDNSGKTVIYDRSSNAHTVTINGTLTFNDDRANALIDLTPTDGNFVVGDGTNWVEESGATARASLGLVIGTDVQAWDADLDTISALSPSQYDVIEWSGSAWAVRDGEIHGSEIIVRSASDLSGALDSTKVYVIDGVVEMGTQTITVPDGGLEIRGLGLNVSRLSSAENTYTMFVDSASNAGNLFLTNLSIDVRGTGSKVWDLDNTSNSDPSNAAVELNAINFENCTEIGTLTGYRQWLLQNSFWISCDDGVTFAGAWAGGAFNSTVLVRDFDPAAGGGAVFKGAAGMTFASRFYSNANISTPTGATVYDFEAAMFTGDAGFELINGQYSGAGTVVSVQTPVIDHTSTKSRFRDNNGIENTYVGGRWFIDTGDAVDTVIAISGTYVKAAGTTTPDDLQWMSLGTANNLTYDSTRTIRAEIKGSINVSAASGGTDKNVTLTLRHWDNSASAYVDLEGVAKGVSTSASTFHNIYVQGYVELDTSDRIELWVQNDTDTVDIGIDEGSSLSIVERAN